MGTSGAEQLTLLGLPAARPPRSRARAAHEELAEHLPIAEVVVERSQPHLDRPFEYEVPASMALTAQPGVRVKVRFGGQDLDGYVVARRAEAEHDGRLAPLRRVVSPEVVLTAPVLSLARAVAARYAGTLADVLRLAVPPRHARVEQEVWPPADAGATGALAPTDEPGQADASGAVALGAAPDPLAGATVWSDYAGGAAFLRRVAEGEAPRAVWQALPGPAGAAWPDAVAAAVLAARGAGRGSLVVVPSAAEVARVEAALTSAGILPWAPGTPGGWVHLMADDGPAARYRAFLAVVRGAADVVVGTRAAAFAPVAHLGLVVCWDDTDHLHAEPRAPYPHARDVLASRSETESAALLVGGLSRSVAAQRWLATGWARPLVAAREAVRARTPRVVALTSVELANEGPGAAARLPGAAWRAIRDGLVRGPVLVQVPRAGYVPAVACRRCRDLARCPACSGPLHIADARAGAQCRWCGRLATDWRCPHCSDTGLRSVRVGSERTAEELGRAFPGVPVRMSGATTGVVARVDARKALVIATPGAEPVAEGGYAAAVLLDAAVLTSRAGLDVPEQALRTWLCAAALVRPAGDGGVVLLVGDAAPGPTQALVRWDPSGLAERELAERSELALPPAVHMIAVEGPRDAVEGLLAAVAASVGSVTTVLGPLAIDERRGERGDDLLDPEVRRPVRALLRTPWEHASVTTAQVAATLAVRSARREQGTVRVQVEPLEVT